MDGLFINPSRAGSLVLRVRWDVLRAIDAAYFGSPHWCNPYPDRDTLV
jgi:hypothetical protein